MLSALLKPHLQVMLPLDGAKTRIQAALPGTVDDVGVWKHLQRVRSREAKSHT